MTLTKPMLACPLLPPSVEHTDEEVLKAMQSLKYPVLATLKKDGIRALKTDDLVSRTLKMIPNESIRRRAMKLPCGFDMELFNPSLEYNEIESIVMSEEHPDSDLIHFHLLDNYTFTGGYAQRVNNVFVWCATTRYGGEVIQPVPLLCATPQELFHWEQEAIREAGEGICFRTLDSPYKQGRSTLKEQYLVKLSRFVRSEVTIIGFIEQQLNANRTKRNAVGMMDRSSFKSGMKGKETLGAFLVRDSNGLEFKVGIGVGLTDSLRLDIWNNQDKWLNKQITIKSKAHGVKVKPRSPIYMGLRQEGY